MTIDHVALVLADYSPTIIIIFHKNKTLARSLSQHVLHNTMEFNIESMDYFLIRQCPGAMDNCTYTGRNNYSLISPTSRTSEHRE